MESTAEEQISELGDRVVGITAIKQNIERRMKRTVWDNIKHTNISIIGVPEGEEKGSEKIFEDSIVEISLP